MERYRKKELLKMVATLLTANDKIGRAVGTDPQGAANALLQCQESAILLGTYIETLDEEYAYLVRILEDYCENIYQMSLDFQDRRRLKELSKKIRNQLLEVNRGIRSDLPQDRREVVFLPYKASMWDSLESIWQAADRDENTDAYVVPIPYFDKNPDGSFRKEHYEGGMYPEYVPVTKYEEYNFAERKPDMIFIHNPYDECNYVTSVHPFFYTPNLKKYTEKLVYVPYFTIRDVRPGDERAIAGMKHFCILPGVIKADKVFVQSEDMRKAYIQVLLEAGGRHSGKERKYWEEKISGCGSPKFDKASNTDIETLTIPKDWMKMITKQDGGRKKVIFYNTAVTALLQNGGQMLNKMKSVFLTFRERREEVVLLWRPHPLMESTILSMRPELWEEYEILRDTYREKGFGIFDDSAKLNRAIALSDAYYGDLSSIVQLFERLGKPVMLENCKIT